MVVNITCAACKGETEATIYQSGPPAKQHWLLMGSQFSDIEADPSACQCGHVYTTDEMYQAVDKHTKEAAL
jgi:hypothetical protein